MNAALLENSADELLRNAHNCWNNPMTNTTDWLACIRAFLHDPPDKALDVRHHEQRAVRYLAAALGTPPESARDEATKVADWLSASIERLPLPKGTIFDCHGNEADPVLEQPFNRIPREDLERTDPVTGAVISNRSVVFRAAQDITGQTVDERAQAIAAIAKANPDPRLRAYALWRLLPTHLEKICQLPGDTRLTDHSIIDHADAATACAVATADGSGSSLLVFSLGPVQQFIVQGRSLRDLWTGSYLLSWLTFHAMVPIIERLGPWCITSPGLRDTPLCDWWLEAQGVVDPGMPGRQHDNASPLGRTAESASGESALLTDALRSNLRWAGIPNTFTALVPTGQAADLCALVRNAVVQEWQRIGDAVLRELRTAWDEAETAAMPAGTAGTWHWQWPQQCAAVWDIRCLSNPVLPPITAINDITSAAATLRSCYTSLVGEVPQAVEDASRIAASLQSAGIAPGYVNESAQGFWPMANELAQRLLEADKRARAVPPAAPADDSREKCALFPGCAVMGPNGDTALNKRWWTDHRIPEHLRAIVKDNERLSAPGLVKRLAYGAYFEGQLGSMPFPDTRAAAFAQWQARVPESAWRQWQRAVDTSNRRTAAVLEDATAFEPSRYWELLDASQCDDKHWLLPDDPQPTRDALRQVSRTIRSARAQLLTHASAVGLPEPKPYYAVLCADGDNMGAVLRGEKGPSFSRAYHPLMLEKLQELMQAGPHGADTSLWSRVRPQGMAAQLSFSTSLNNFTRHAASAIDEYHGTCVYAGGDDVLAVMPVTTCLTAAARLAALFQREVGGTLSCGLAIVHCLDDLRTAIEKARGAEAYAKQSGRDGLTLRIVRRSGETSQAYCPWVHPGHPDEHADPQTGATTTTWRMTENLVAAWSEIATILADQSDRWVHHLIQERAALQAVAQSSGLAPVWQRIKHLVLHGEEGAKHSQGALDGLLSHLTELWSDSARGFKARSGYTERPPVLRDHWLVDQFITWCQHAAWLSRFMVRPSQKTAKESVS